MFFHHDTSNMKRILFGTLLALLLAGQAFSQQSSMAYHKLADSLYQNHHYQFAADYYEKALKKSQHQGNIMLQLAKCYQKINLIAESEKWFVNAKRNHATFTNEDNYQFAQTLIILRKGQQADSILEHILLADPHANAARKVLDDLRNFQKFYQDSASVRINSLSINTTVSEFAPVFYKEGIVFSSAKQEGPFRKKYHWDNSHFLNLYYSAKKADQRFDEPKLFEKELNTRYHDGPATFYAKFQKMIINRNQKVKVSGREDVYEWRPGLYDAQFDAAKSSWTVAPLQFNEPAYSYGHPSISEDGNILYFISDRPGGYGGSDIYRVMRTNGVWSTPFNLGPTVNTVEDEAFPFFIDNTLYFASNGHGGLGGLDVFKCTQTVNGFAPPLNLGYPINSTADDFSLITDPAQRTGYYASSRQGNDDLFSFQWVTPKMNILAHIFDGETEEPLSGATIQLISDNGNDSTMMADSKGDFTFKLPNETAYILIGTKDDRIGMVSDIADQQNEKQLIAAFRDTTRLVCIGIIKNEEGLSQKAHVISITDETTGKKIGHPDDRSLISFKGEKGHNYSIEIQNDQGDKAVHQLIIGLHDRGTKIWTMIIPATQQIMNMAARIFRADNNEPLAQASVKVITFGETDQELTANNEGIVDFNLKQGTAYVVIGSKDDLTGMHSGMAERGTDKTSIIHPVPAYGDRLNTVPTIGLVTNISGELVDAYVVTVTNKATGQHISVEAKKGILTFLGKRGEAYNISVSHENYISTLQELNLPSTGPVTEKFSVLLESKPGDRKNISPTESTMIVQNIKSGTSALIGLDTEDGTSKLYVTSGKSLSEVTENHGKLYIQTPKGNEYLGKGILSELRTDPSTTLKGLGLRQSDLKNLRNIYFDFDKSTLDADDKEYLQQVKKILEHDRSNKLIVAGHADDRGNENYNLKLSRRRAEAVNNYLVDQGIPKEQIIKKAFGESLLAVPCRTTDCSEEDHQKNRRAEFVLGRGAVQTATPALSKKLGKPKSSSTQYDSLLKTFGEKKAEGLSFKVSIGAYRNKPDLTFAELSDLGKIESVRKSGITYYYLSEFPTWKEVETVRHEVIKRGVEDASVAIYHNGGKITFSNFIILTQ